MLTAPTPCFDRLILRQAQESGSPPYLACTFSLPLTLSPELDEGSQGELVDGGEKVRGQPANASGGR